MLILSLNLGLGICGVYNKLVHLEGEIEMTFLINKHNYFYSWLWIGIQKAPKSMSWIQLEQISPPPPC